jgi:hypothetical protein
MNESSKKIGFYLRQLTLKGAGLEDATISFGPGCNVITGASNTGKSYIVRCIKFALGKGKVLNRVDEDDGYQQVLLEIETNLGQVVTLVRDLVETNRVVCANCSIEEYSEISDTTKFVNYNATNQKTKQYEPLSEFLLHISGFKNDELISKNSNNKKKRLGFGDVLHLTLIDEVSIQKEPSPVFNVNSTTETAEGAVFQILVSGIDSKDLDEIEDVSDKKSVMNAQIELMDRMFKKVSHEISILRKEEKSFDNSIDEDIEEINQQYIEIDKELNKKSATRSDLWNSISELKSKVLNIQELLIRFEILKKQYIADVERLNFIDEGEHLLSQLNQQKCLCPVCDNEIQNSDLNDDLKLALSSEKEKISLNLAELTETIVANDNEEARLESLLADKIVKYGDCENEIKKSLLPNKESIQNRLKDLVLLQNKKIRLNSLRDQSSTYTNEKNELTAQINGLKKVKGSRGEIDKDKLNSFLYEVKSLLVSWGCMSSDGNVDFNTNWKVLDLIIDSKARASNGKGVRAILHSAFTLALLIHSSKENLAHPRFVVIDTPLKSFRDKDSGFDETTDIELVKDNFYHFFETWDNSMQVIILENEIPNSKSIENLHYLHFSGEEGETGFIPEKKDKIQ